ncbi:MAG TPA: DinB family protein [Vicinamibacterales bacterium]|nr:DinB family protein [Vicinamibacterales bacterium]
MEGSRRHGAAFDRLADLAAVRTATIAKVTPLSQAQLDFSPRPGRWSIGEIADHLRLSELLWRGEISRLVDLAREGKPTYLKRSFADINVSPALVPDAVLSMLEVPLGIMSRFMPDAIVGMMTELPILPMRNPDAATPRARRPAAELIAELNAAIAQTERLIEANAGLDFDRMISAHPLMGSNNVPQMLTIVARHERRHHVQMDRVRADSGFPRL